MNALDNVFPCFTSQNMIYYTLVYSGDFGNICGSHPSKRFDPADIVFSDLVPVVSLTSVVRPVDDLVFFVFRPRSPPQMHGVYAGCDAAIMRSLMPPARRRTMRRLAQDPRYPDDFSIAPHNSITRSKPGKRPK